MQVGSDSSDGEIHFAEFIQWWNRYVFPFSFSAFKLAFKLP